MSPAVHDEGIIQVIMDRFANQRLPRALEIKSKLEEGDTLSSLDLIFLDEVLHDLNHRHLLMDRHPEYQDLVARAIHLYKEIADLALANEKSHQQQSGGIAAM